MDEQIALFTAELTASTTEASPVAPSGRVYQLTELPGTRFEDIFCRCSDTSTLDCPVHGAAAA